MAHPDGVLPSPPRGMPKLSDRLRRRFARHRNRGRRVLRRLLRLPPNRPRPPGLPTSSPSSTCCSDPGPRQRSTRLQRSTRSAYHHQSSIGVVFGRSIERLCPRAVSAAGLPCFYLSLKVP
jgi:hypothetical protein